jgi:hypothetical protein
VSFCDVTGEAAGVPRNLFTIFPNAATTLCQKINSIPIMLAKPEVTVIT